MLRLSQYPSVQPPRIGKRSYCDQAIRIDTTTSDRLFNRPSTSIETKRPVESNTAYQKRLKLMLENHPDLATVRKIEASIEGTMFAKDLVLQKHIIEAYSFHPTGLPDLLRTFQQYQSQWRVDAVTHSHVVRSYIRSDQMTEATAHLKHMIAQGIVPTLGTWTEMLTHFLKTGKFQEAFHFMSNFTEGKIKPHESAWFKLKDAFSKLNDFENEMKCHEIMKSLGMNPPNVISLPQIPPPDSNSIQVENQDEISQLGQRPDENLAEWKQRLIFNLNSTRNLNLVRAIEVMTSVSHLSKDDQLRASLIDQYSRNPENRNDLIRVFDQFESDGLITSPYVWEDVIRADLKAGNFENAAKRFSKMKIEPTKRTWLNLLEFQLKTNTPENALEFLCQKISAKFPPPREAWFSLMWYFTKKGLADLQMKAYRQMKNSNLKLDLKNFNILLGSLGKSGKIEEMDNVFQDLKVENVPDSLTYLHLIQGAAEAGRSDLVEGYIDEAQKIEKLPITLWNVIISAFGKVNKSMQARNIFDKMSLSGIIPTEWSWNSLLQSYGSNFQLDLMLKTFEEMKQSGIKPSAVTWSIMISGMVRKEPFENNSKLEHILSEEEKKLSRFELAEKSLETAIEKTGQSLLAEEIFGKMPEYPSGSKLIVGAMKFEERQEAVAKFHRLLKDEKNTKWRAVGPSTFNLKKSKTVKQLVESALETVEIPWMLWASMIHAMGEIAEPKEALRLFEMMRSQDLEGTEKVWHSVINALGKNDEIDLMLKMFDEYKSGNRPSTETYTSVIHSLAKPSHVLQLENVIQDVTQVENSSIVHCQELVTVIVHALGKVGKFQEAQETFIKFRERGFRPHQVAWNVLLNILGKDSQLEFMMKLFNDMKDKNAVTWCIVISRMADAQRSDQVEKLISRAKTEIRNPGESVWAVMIEAMLKIGKEDEAKKLYLEMRQSGIVPSSSWYILLKIGTPQEFDEISPILQELGKNNTISWKNIREEDQFQKLLFQVENQDEIDFEFPEDLQLELNLKEADKGL